MSNARGHALGTALDAALDNATRRKRWSVPASLRFQRTTRRVTQRVTQSISVFQDVLDRRNHPHRFLNLVSLEDPRRLVAREDLEDPLVRAANTAQ